MQNAPKHFGKKHPMLWSLACKDSFTWLTAQKLWNDAAILESLGHCKVDFKMRVGTYSSSVTPVPIFSLGDSTNSRCPPRTRTISNSFSGLRDRHRLRDTPYCRDLGSTSDHAYKPPCVGRWWNCQSSPRL